MFQIELIFKNRLCYPRTDSISHDGGLYLDSPEIRSDNACYLTASRNSITNSCPYVKFRAICGKRSAVRKCLRIVH